MFARREVEGLAEVLRHLGRACYAGGRANAPGEEEDPQPSYDGLRAEVSGPPVGGGGGGGNLF
jgi:hypothetical protein